MGRIAIVTGSTGLVGSETVRLFSRRGFQCVGIDNDMRRVFFGEDASTSLNRKRLTEEVPGYVHRSIDIRDTKKLEKLFVEYGSDTAAVIHAAGQPSHDWAAREPDTDFTINANGTLNLLELTRRFCPKTPFIFVSTNKVYGDRPNALPLGELDTRWEVASSHPFAEHGIDETMSIDQSKHSLFGVSKTAADLLVQEYGNYFDMRTVCFRCGCITGPSHAGAQLHGFLSYLVKCAVAGEPYTVFGYKGKQVRDNLHAADLAEGFYQFYLKPRSGEVYNLGGSRENSCSVLEAVTLCEGLTGRRLHTSYVEQNRAGDHIWYISDVRKFSGHYPDWTIRFDLRTIIEQIVQTYSRRTGAPA